MGVVYIDWLVWHATDFFPFHLLAIDFSFLTALFYTSKFNTEHCFHLKYCFHLEHSFHLKVLFCMHLMWTRISHEVLTTEIPL